jgi:hypothetical protein
VTAVMLPAITAFAEPSERLAVFDKMEGRFSSQAKFSVTLAGLSGFYMAYRLDAWDRFTDPSFWWMHAMVALWALFTIILFVAEPLFLHAWFRERARRDSEGTFALIGRLHRIILILLTATILGAALGAHGLLF